MPPGAVAEFTGLFLDNCQPSYLDDMQDRYTKARESTAAFEITQFGLSCFQQSEDGRAYTARTFNAYTYREPLAWEVSGGAASRKFMCDAGSLSFLATQGFDFNKWVAEGVPYMPLKTHEQRMQQVRGGGGGGGWGRRAGAR